jgi:hypothetical protein
MSVNPRRDLTQAKWFQRGFAILLLGVVANVYYKSLAVGLWPPGHPWSALFFVTFAAFWWIKSLQSPSRSANSAKRLGMEAAALSALSVVWATIWLITASIR